MPIDSMLVKIPVLNLLRSTPSQKILISLMCFLSVDRQFPVKDDGSLEILRGGTLQNRGQSEVPEFPADGDQIHEETRHAHDPSNGKGERDSERVDQLGIQAQISG